MSLYALQATISETNKKYVRVIRANGKSDLDLSGQHYKPLFQKHTKTRINNMRVWCYKSHLGQPGQHYKPLFQKHTNKCV